MKVITKLEERFKTFMCKTLTYLEKDLRNDDENHYALLVGHIALLRLHQWIWDSGKIPVLKLIVLLLFMDITCFGLLGHLIHYIMNNSFDHNECWDDIAVILSGSSANFMNIMHFKQVNKLWSSLKMLSDFTHFEMPNSYLATNRLCTFFGIFFTMCHYFIAVATFSHYAMQDCPPGAEAGCGLIVEVYFPLVNTAYGKGHYIMLALEVINAFGLGINTFLVTWTYLSIVEIFGSYFDHLKDMLRKIPKLKDPRARRVQFRKCARYYLHIIEMSAEFLPNVSKINYVHVVNSPLVMSAIAFQLLDEFVFIFFVHFLVWFYGTGLTCAIGQRLINKSGELTDVIYESMVWDGDYVLGKDMALMLLRAQREMKMTGGDMVVCDHVLFVTIMKGVYSYLTLFAD